MKKTLLSFLLWFALMFYPSLSYSDDNKTDSAYRYLYHLMNGCDGVFEKPKFIDSYHPIFQKEGSEPEPVDTGYVYDNALALIAFMARGNPEDAKRARIVADAFVYAAMHDRYYRDGRLRNAYTSKTLINPKDSTAMLPGWWDNTQQQWKEDKLHISTHTGNMAWCIIALITYYEKAGGEPYLKTALQLGQWIETETRAKNGYSGGYEGWEPDPEKISWISVEHNIDVYIAFKMIYKLTRDKKWEERALHAKIFVHSMWDENHGHFWTGASTTRFGPNTANIPLDIHALAIMAMPDDLIFREGINWVENNCLTQADGFKGFDFNPDKDGVWFEGTAQMAVAYRIINENKKADFYIKQLRTAKTSPVDGTGEGIIAASRNPVTTGFEWQYPRLLHIGSTAWYIFAELGYNPFKS